MEKVRIKRLAIIGASGHGKVIADIAEKNGYNEIIFFDDNEKINECFGFKVMGKTSDIVAYKEWDFIVAIGNSQIRREIQTHLRKYNIITLIHPNSCIGRRVKIGQGSVIMAGVVINSDTIIGDGCIINTSSSVDHDCIIGDYVHVAVGAHVAGNVCVSNNSWIGAGATISNNLSICTDCIIGAGAVVIHDINTPGIYVGIPAQKNN